jgi:hypothetical protein
VKNTKRRAMAMCKPREKYEVLSDDNMHVP